MIKVEEVPELELGLEPRAKEISGCALQCVRGVADILGAQDAYSATNAKEFDRILKKGHNSGEGFYKGQYITATIVAISDASYNKGRFEPTIAALKARGFKFLGKFPGAHPDLYGSYSMHLYGLGFTEIGEPK